MGHFVFVKIKHMMTEAIYVSLVKLNTIVKPAQTQPIAHLALIQVAL